jgi:hypothetical protein
MLMRRAATAALLWTLSAPAWADSVWVGGGSVADTTQVAYFGRVGPLPGKQLSDGWSQSVFVDYVSYEYGAGGRQINGKVNGIKFSVGREFRRDSGFVGISLGVGASNTTLHPDDPGNANRGFSVHPVGELQWRSHAESPWRSTAYAQYVFGARRDFATGFLGRRLSSGIAIGPQMATGGDPNYRIYGLALALNGWKVGPLDMGFYAGAQHSEGGGTHPEIGLSFSAYRPD